MVVTAYWFAAPFIQAFDKKIDYVTDDIAHTLHTVGYVPNQDTHDFFDDLTNQLATANGYTAEDGTGTGLLAGGKVNSNTLNVVKFDANDPAWTFTGAGNTARILVASDVTTNVTTTDPLLWWSDFGANETASGGGTFTYVYAAGGAATITPADATGFP